jgi:hypothetical protein
LTLCCSMYVRRYAFYALFTLHLSIFYRLFFLLKCIYLYSERRIICWCCVPHSTLSSSFAVCCSISFHFASIYILSSFSFFLLKCIYHYSERYSICWCCVHHSTLSSSLAFDTVLFYVCSSLRILCPFRSASNYILTSFLSVLLQCIYHYSERHSICWCCVHHLTLSSSVAFCTSLFVVKIIYLLVLCASFSVFFHFCLSRAVFMDDTIDLCIFRLCFALLHC